MISPARRRTLLEAAESEAKRLGHTRAGALHLALVLARQSPDLFDERLGAGAGARVVRLLRKVADASEHSAESVLSDADGDTDAALIDALVRHAPQLEGSGQAATPRLSDGEEVQHHAGAKQQPAPEPQTHETRPVARGTDRLLDPMEPDHEVIGRDELVSELLGLLCRRTPLTPLIVGRPGSGRTAVARALAVRLTYPERSASLAGWTVMRLNVAAILAGHPIDRFDRALDMVAERQIAFVDDLEVLALMGTPSPLLPVLARLRGAIEDHSMRLLVSIDQAYLGRLEMADQGLFEELQRIEITELADDALSGIIERHVAALTAHHGVTIPRDIVPLAAARDHTALRAQPALGVERLDAAGARASLRADRVVRLEDMAGSASVASATVDVETLAATLRQQVRGQEPAIDAVVSRLALTRARLDLRPERPDGVFLFVGPTGVGKTELARAICAAVYGAEDRLIRLDMSEYAEPWALARLIGPQPGYVGYTEPDAWLTTRVRERSECVVLLDEIEKAHPQVWNAFLQVFDAGRLSDARGNVADFSKAVIIMTSNLGAAAYRTSPIGFSAGEDERRAVATERVHDAVRLAMPPEFINRLDDVVAFSPLDRGTIAEIANDELAHAIARLDREGYLLTIDPEVAARIAEVGYDPTYGARHLQRNIESLLLRKVALVPHRGRLHATVEQEEVVVRPVGTS